ncbi:MAG: hypothetical protein OXC93_13940 [Rhodospirillaceae bacterium]|nr:hypothetical protein [Rhodospirillaceae bacterium]
MSFSFLPAVRRLPVFLPSAKLAAAALVATVMATPAMAAAASGAGTAGDIRTTRWTEQKIGCSFPCLLQTSSITHNSVTFG